MKIVHVTILINMLTGFLGAQTQRAEVYKINSGEDVLISLNPDYLVFSPFKKLEAKTPLLLYLHGAGGGRAPLERLGGQARALLSGINKFGKESCYVVVPQCFQKTKSGEKSTWEPSDLNLLLDELLKKNFPLIQIGYT